MATVNLSAGSTLNQVNNALVSGNDVILGAGAFNLAGLVVPQNGTTLEGQGTGLTIINFTNGGFDLTDLSNFTMGGFTITGTILSTNWCGIKIFAKTKNIANLHFHDITGGSLSTSLYDLLVQGYGASNITWIRIDASLCGGGFIYIMGSGINAANIVSDTVFYACKEEHAGYSGASQWVPGWDLAEAWTGNDSLVVKNMTVMKCAGDGAWESVFHWENFATKTGIVVIDNNACNAGHKIVSGVTPTFGAGFLASFKSTAFGDSSNDDLIFNGNTAVGDNNYIADLYGAPDGGKHSLPMDFVFNRTATVNRISQGNCIGVDIVNTAASPVTHDLFLYSSDGNPVNQTITLSDGTVATVSFTDFMIERGIPSTSTTGSFGYNGAGTYSSSGLVPTWPLFCEPGYTGVTATGKSMSFLTSNSDTVAHNIQMAIYTLSGSTFSLVAQTNPISVPAGAAKGWVTGNLTTSPNLSAGTTYYLAVNGDSTKLIFYVDQISGVRQYTFNAAFGTWPATFSSPTLNWNVAMPIQLNYTVGFTHGTVHTGTFPVTVAPSGLACQVELYLGPNAGTKSATSGLVPFTSTGASQNLAPSVTMPTAGTYNVYINIYAGSVLVGAFEGTTPVVVV